MKRKLILIVSIVFLFYLPNLYYNNFYPRVFNKIHYYFNEVKFSQNDTHFFSIDVSRRSFFEIDSLGQLKHDNQGNPIENENIYKIRKTFQPSSTSLIIMDPWEDMSSEFLNSYYKKIIDKNLIPVVSKTIENGINIIILTNDCFKVDYNCKIDQELKSLLNNYDNYEILYHQDYTPKDFGDYLFSKGLNNLIYTGFGSNQCVIGRPLGMITMKNLYPRNNYYFIPESSGGVEFQETWKSQQIHSTTTTIISQWIGDIINSESFLNFELLKYN